MKEFCTFQPIDVENYINTYWRYYTSLEDDYITLHNIDEKHVSIAHVKLYLAICSEIDVLFKVICQAVKDDYRGDNMKRHLTAMANNVQNGDWDDLNQNIQSLDGTEAFSPWKKYELKDFVPLWWTKYNKVKHQRTCLNTQSGLLYFYDATLNNIKQSLGGLYAEAEGRSGGSAFTPFTFSNKAKEISAKSHRRNRSGNQFVVNFETILQRKEKTCANI